MTTEIVGLHPGLKNNYRQQQGGTLDGNRLADNFGAGAIRRAAIRDGQYTIGHWRFECQKAVTVVDPGKLESLLAKYAIRFRAPPQQVHESLLTRVLPVMRRADARQLEQVVFGGGRRWEAEVFNKIVNQGLDSVNDVYLGASTQITTWYVGLIKTGNTYAAADTLASHAGWTESQDYSESVRQTWTKNGASSSQSITNSSSKATFSMNATVTILGGFLASNSTKGGTTGTLYSEADLAASRSVVSGDSLLITASFTQASST